MWKKILCPVDFSAGSHDAMRTAAQLAKESDGEVIVMHVWAAPVYTVSEPIGLLSSQLSQLAGEAEKRLAEACKEVQSYGAPKVTSVFRSGAPWQEVVHFAERDESIEVIVAGTHGRTGLTRALIGSVAEKIVRHAPCPVLVVRDRA